MKINNETKVGALALVSIALLFFGYNVLMGNDLFNNNNVYYAKYPKVDGVSPASTVIFNGLPVGKVKKIDLSNDQKILIKFEVRKDIKIPLNSTAKIVSSDLLGSKSLELLLSKNSQIVEDGDTILGKVEVSLTEKVNETILPVKVKAEQLISSLDTMVQVIEMMFDEDARRNIGKSLENFTSALESMKGTATQVEIIVNEETRTFQKILDNIESISKNIERNNATITSLLENMDAISDSVQRANVTMTINNAMTALEEVAIIMEKVNKGEGSLAMFLNDTKLYDNLNHSAASLDSLMIDLKENPKRYVSISVFGGGKEKKVKKKKPGLKKPKGADQ